MVQKESPIPSSSDKSHVIRTSAQWDSSGDQYHVIPRGVLCIELTSNGKTKIKVGEGNKFYSQLPYICDMGELSNYYTKEEVDLIVENLEFMSIKSTEEYDSRNQLPKIGNKLGDVRFVKNPNNQYDDPLLYVWNGSKWVFSGGSIIDIDLSEYCKKSEILPRLQQLEALSHTHRNKDILDSTSAIYTTEKDEKLASLKNYDVFVPATEEEDGVDGLVPAPSTSETDKFLRGDGTWVDVESEKYSAGEGISFETEQWTVSEEFIGRESEWTNWTFYGPTSAEGTGWDTMVTNAENRSTRCHEIISRTLKIEAWDINNRALWTVVFLYDQNGTHYTSTNWQKTGTGIVHIIPDSAAYFGIGLARLPDTDTQYSDGRRERMTPSEVKSVKAMWLVEDSGDESEIYIHNDGVLDITQENPDALNELTVHFRESSKGITIPSDAYVLPPATDTTLGGVIVGDGLEITEEGVLSGNEYHAGTAISMSGEAILPVEYQQIEYLESTGTQYINPELLLWSDSRNKCEITFAYTELGNDTWAAGIYNGYYGYVAGVAPINGAWYTASGTTYDPNVFETNTIITSQFNYDNSYQSLLLFCRGASNVGPASFSKSRIYHVKFTRDSDTLGDMYPCIRKSDNVPGMYDIVRNRFFTNAGTGDFICGNVIRTDGNIINVNIGQGLSVDNDNNIVNDGVLEVSEKQSAPGVFTVSKRNTDTDIDLFDSLGKITINCNMNPD